jgi:hypothetical protein
MVAPSSSRRRTKLRNILDVITNIVVVVFALVAIGVLVKNYFSPTVTRPNIGLKSGDVFPPIEGADYKKAPRTLILALNVDCRYCTKSLPFYNSLASAQKENPNLFSVVAAFINKEEERVRSYVEEKALSVHAIAGVDLDKLGIHSTPTLILVDSGGKILDSWTGGLKHEGEVEVFTAIGLPYRPTASTSTVSSVKKTADIFSEERSVLSIQPESKPQSDITGFVEVFDVNSQRDIYLVSDKTMYTYDGSGALKHTQPLPSGFRSPFCVDDDGVIYSAGKRGVSIFTRDLVKIKDLSLGDQVPLDLFTLKLELDQKRGAVYAQVYSPEPLFQSLYKIDLKSERVSEVYRLPRPVRFNPTYTPGAFDFALGDRFLYVSDIYDYKVYLYSLENDVLVKSVKQPYDSRRIEKEDGQFHIRKMIISGLGQGEGLAHYPPIVHLNYTEKGNLLVWTSQRDASGRQVVDVYDSQLKKIGTDLKFINPGRSNMVFLNQHVYVPDYGFGSDTKYSGSPLEIPAAPFSLKVFDASL